MIDNEKMIEANFLPYVSRNVILPEIMIAYFVNSKKINLCKILRLQRLSIELLNHVAENVIMNSNFTDIQEKEIFNDISTFQIMDPKFIEKYDNMLNWSLLMFNQTWTLFPHSSFHKLPVMNHTNSCMWESIYNKINELNSYGIYAEKYQDEYIKIHRLNVTHLSHNIRFYNLFDSKKDRLIQQFNQLYYNTPDPINSPKWIIRSTSNGLGDCNIIKEKDYNKIVFTFNKDIMDNNTNLYNHLQNNYNSGTQYTIPFIPMIFCSNHHSNKKNIIVHHKNLLIVNKNPANSMKNLNNIFLYFPLGTEIQIVDGF